MNQPSNVEDVRTTRRLLINAGYRSGKTPVFFLGAKLLLAIAVGASISDDSCKGFGIPERFETHILLCPARSLWLLCSSALVAKSYRCCRIHFSGPFRMC